MTKAYVAFRNFANKPKNLKIFTMQEIVSRSQILNLLARIYIYIYIKLELTENIH
jgi:hypothetical protein